MAALSMAAASVAGCVDGEGSSPTDTETPGELTLDIGEEWVAPSSVAVAVTEIEFREGEGETDGDSQPVRVHVEAENRGDEEATAPLVTEWYVLGDDGSQTSAVNSTYATETRDMLPGRSSSGYINFEAPSDLEREQLEGVLLNASDRILWVDN